MVKKLVIKQLPFVVAALALATPANANIAVLNATSGSVTMFGVDTGNLGTSGCSSGSVECPATVVIDSTGALFGVTGNPFFVTIKNASLAVTAASLPLPTLAATSTKQSDGSQKTQIVDSLGTVLDPATLSTAANQSTANASLATIATNTGTATPPGSTMETASATGTTGATTATLATAGGKTTYICGFSIRANATAAATGDATVTGVITGTMHFTQWTSPLASGLGVNEQTFSPCIPASATNTTLAVVSAAPGSGGTVSVSAWGFQL